VVAAIMRIPALLAALMMMIATASPSSAQGGYALGVQPGAQVRYTVRGAEGETVQGHAFRVSRDTLFVTPDHGDGALPARPILLADLATLQVRGGRAHARGAAIGAVGLGIVTGIAGGVDYAHGNITFGDFIGTLAGNIALGAGVGYLLAPVGWVRLPLPGR
jgi:hypothetical protein